VRACPLAWLKSTATVNGVRAEAGSFFLVKTPSDPAPSKKFLSPASRSRNRQHCGMGFHCVKCWTFLNERPEGERVLCGKCRERAIAVEERRERKARIVGRQPLICEHCSEPFLGTRLGHRFCSTSCRMAAWRARQRVPA
jgi:predicted nucleic acid-binding Zn ribbon protein